MGDGTRYLSNVEAAAIVVDGRWSRVDGQGSMVKGQWSMVDGQWSMTDDG
jgi:hypothetical protein